ncbi:MAG: class I SAM-dependent methyltransferase [Thermodesulfobacteriota bacterium]|nr:class I SAM-dependent methyltransferase [Thermodesulfobacteriota bacterium]
MGETVPKDSYWKKFFGVELFKVEYFFKMRLYRLFGLKLPKLKDQRDYWSKRGVVYMDEIIKSGYLDREIFFQDMIIDELRGLDFSSCFEAGCGFGWNVRRVKEEFPEARVGGLDFSMTQLNASKRYMEGFNVPVSCGDNRRMPLKDNAFDVGFSLGVFMNIHPDKIMEAINEMVRVCGKYAIHLEYDKDNTTPELREKRAFKTNIVSHNYADLYQKAGCEVVKFLTYKDFENGYRDHQKGVSSSLDRWEGFEGPEKYIFIVVDTQTAQ